MRRTAGGLLLALACAALAVRSSGAPGGSCTPGWQPTFGGLPGPGQTHALLEYDDGSGPALYAGGPELRLSRWDGSRWSLVGTGTDDTVWALAEFDDGSGRALYVGGEFATAGGVPSSGIARWNGSSWSGMAGGTDRIVRALAVHDDGSGPALYAAGDFTTAGGVAANRIARWDGASWSALGSGIDGEVWTLASHDDGTGPALFAGGSFATAGGVAASQVARWDGSAWSPLGGGTSGGEVRALTSYDDGSGTALYAGGAFTTAGGLPASRIARWDGSTWSELGGGADAIVASLAVHDGAGGAKLYAGGWFMTAGGGASRGVACWDGTSWSAAGAGVAGWVQCMTLVGDGDAQRLFAGGSFTKADGAPATGIARWDGASWSPLDTGLDGAVHSLAVYDDGGGPTLWAGGAFSGAGGVAASQIARWDERGWSAPGGDVVTGFGVNALAVYDDGNGGALYAGGQSLRLNGQPEVLLRWDGSTWTGVPGLGSWSAARVFALATYDDGGGTQLYAGGWLSGGIRRWNGATWSDVGGGVSVPVVNAMLVHDDGSGPALYVCGLFSTAGGVPAASVARWNGAWSAVGNTDHAGPEAMAVYDDGNGPKLYVGGAFLRIGGVDANRVARWDGTSWSALGAGIQGNSRRVKALAAFDDGNGPALYAGGDFQLAGGVLAEQIARWNGTSWSAVGSGFAAQSYLTTTRALIVHDDGGGPALVAGGSFGRVPDSGDSLIARWGCPGGIGTRFCLGEATSCPCGNAGAPGRGCDNAQATGGVSLALARQSPSGRATLSGTGLPGGEVAILVRAGTLDLSAPIRFGDGLRCLSTTSLVRISAVASSGGAATHVVDHGAASPGTFWYQLWYRDAPRSFCNATEAFNLSNGLRMEW